LAQLRPRSQTRYRMKNVILLARQARRVSHTPPGEGHTGIEGKLDASFEDRRDLIRPAWDGQYVTPWHLQHERTWAASTPDTLRECC
jgi:hypothetical protein